MAALSTSTAATVLDEAALDALLDEALVARSLLHRESQRARIEGRPAEWWAARPPSQPFVGIENQGATCYLNAFAQQLFIATDRCQAQVVCSLLLQRLLLPARPQLVAQG